MNSEVSPNSCAIVSALPTAAAAPIRQQVWRGRYPRGVKSMNVARQARLQAKRDREQSALEAKEIEHRIEQTHSYLAFLRYELARVSGDRRSPSGD